MTWDESMLSKPSCFRFTFDVEFGIVKLETVTSFESDHNIDSNMASYSTNQRLIESRRRQEAKYQQMDAAIAEDRKIFQIASFEQLTSNKINKKIIQVTQVFQI